MCLYMCIYIRTHTHTYTVTHTYIILRGHFMHLNWIDVVWSSCLYVTLEMTLGVSLCGVGLMLEENQDKEIVIRKVKPGSNADRSVYQENSVPEILQCVAVCCCTCSVVLHCVLQIECWRVYFVEIFSTINLKSFGQRQSPEDLGLLILSAEDFSTKLVLKSRTEWPRTTGCLILIGNFPQKSPMISGSFAKNVLQVKESYGSSPPCHSLEDLEFTVYKRSLRIEASDIHPIVPLVLKTCQVPLVPKIQV